MGRGHGWIWLHLDYRGADWTAGKFCGAEPGILRRNDLQVCGIYRNRGIIYLQ